MAYTDDPQMGSRRRALVDSLAGNTGMSGMGPGGVQPPPVEAAPAPAATAPTSPLGAFANTLEGFNGDKLSNLNHASPKYQIGRALSQFDPRQGVTPDVLAALNKLGIGEFSGSGDKVTIKNGDPRFEGVSSLDLVRAFKDPNSNGGWQYGVEGPAPATAGARPMFAAGTISPMLQGDAQSNIQAAMQNIGGLANTSRIQQLIQALGGGQV